MPASIVDSSAAIDGNRGISDDIELCERGDIFGNGGRRLCPRRSVGSKTGDKGPIGPRGDR